MFNSIGWQRTSEPIRQEINWTGRKKKKKQRLCQSWGSHRAQREQRHAISNLDWGNSTVVSGSRGSPLWPPERAEGASFACTKLSVPLLLVHKNNQKTTSFVPQGLQTPPKETRDLTWKPIPCPRLWKVAERQPSSAIHTALSHPPQPLWSALALPALYFLARSARQPRRY